MSKYIENVNDYLSKKKIKQSYISLKSGIEKNKLSRILKEAQEITVSDMESIAKSLGKKAEFFLNEEYSYEERADMYATDIVFYAGEPSAEQELFAENLVNLIRNADEILSAKARYNRVVVGE